MRVVDCEQGTYPWFEARCGRLTASRASDFMAVLKRSTNEAAPRRNYRTELLTERLTGKVQDHYVSKEMEWGSANEGFARTAYEMHTGEEADLVGFIFHPYLDYAGASPDSLVGTDGGLEIKCPASSTHLEWFTAGVVPEEHRDQMYMNMLCAERNWWDFVSYDPRLPAKLQFFGRRLQRDDKRIAEIEREILKLNAEIEFLAAELGVETILPPIDSFLDVKSKKHNTVRIGSVDVPADLAEMLDDELVP